MNTRIPLEREELVEQAYFFRVFRQRLADNLPAQEILTALHEEILTTTRLPYAIQFLGSELKHSGLLNTGFQRLSHYFTAFQAFVIAQAEQEGLRFTMPTALQILEREATYKSQRPTKPGLFVFQFEALCRNRLGYHDGLIAMAADPFYDEAWVAYLASVRRQVGVIDFADLVFLRSELYATEWGRSHPEEPLSHPPLFGEKEGRIARASRGRDPLYLFAALQRQLDYPEVPRMRAKETEQGRIDMLVVKLRELEARLKLVEGETRGSIDLSALGKPQLLSDDD